jgi:hypothetical protein
MLLCLYCAAANTFQRKRSISALKVQVVEDTNNSYSQEALGSEATCWQANNIVEVALPLIVSQRNSEGAD